MKKVTIDLEKCLGGGTCAYTCPEGIEMNEENKPVVINSELPCIGEAAEMCPVKCITIEEEV